MSTSLKKFTVKEEDIDILKHVNYQVYIKHFERARFNWFEQNNVDFHTLLDEGLTFVLRKLETTYHHEARLGDELFVETKLGYKGNRSFSMEQVMYNQDDRKVSETTSVMVMFDMNKRKSIPVIDEIAQFFDS